jgi:hypothetical protein
MEWLEAELHFKYHSKKHYHEWFRLDEMELRELTDIQVRDPPVPEDSLLGRWIELTQLSDPSDGLQWSVAQCSDYLQGRGWETRAYAVRSTAGEAWFVVAERGLNRIARGGKTEANAWRRVVFVEYLAFHPRQPSCEGLLFQGRDIE